MKEKLRVTLDTAEIPWSASDQGKTNEAPNRTNARKNRWPGINSLEPETATTSTRTSWRYTRCRHDLDNDFDRDVDHDGHVAGTMPSATTAMPIFWTSGKNWLPAMIELGR